MWEIAAKMPVFDAIQTIVEYGYVLVRDEHRTITGIVTPSDLTLRFQTLTEPFPILREIELHVRRLLSDKVSTADFDLLGWGGRARRTSLEAQQIRPSGSTCEYSNIRRSGQSST